MNNPKISIIVPVYNVKNYLKRCVETLTHQTLKEIEIILVDDGSTDSSGKLCDTLAKKDSRIKVIHQKNQGLSEARNNGMKIATGDYIGFVDSDDKVALDMFEKLYNRSVITKADVVFCDYANVKNNKVVYHKSRIAKQFLKYPVFDIKKINPQPDSRGRFAIISLTWNKLYKADIAKKYLHFPAGLAFEDSVIVFQTLAMSNKISAVNEKLYFYTIDNSSSLAKSKDRKVLDLITADTMMIENLHNFNYGYFCEFCVIGLIRDVFRHFHKIDHSLQREYFVRMCALLLKMREYDLLKWLKFKHRLKAFIFTHCGFRFSKMISKI